MSNNIRINETDYELLLESAQKTAETMSPEQIAELRTKCNYELGKIIDETEKLVSIFTEYIEHLKKPKDYSSINPVKRAKTNFWLGQLVNFIAVTFFKVPREFTPTYGYPHGSATAFEEYAKASDAKLLYSISTGKAISEAAGKGFKDIRKIIADNAGLVAFCNSCEIISLADNNVAVSDTFRRIASLLYLNNVSFDVEVFRTDIICSKLTDGVDAAVEEIKRAYEEARELSAVSEGIIRCYEKAKSLPDLIGGIRRIIKTGEKKQTVCEPVEAQAAQPDTALLLQRAFQFLEDREWKYADAYCEKTLDLDPINAEAYLGKLMAELHVETRDILKYLSEAFDDRENYRRAFRFGDETLKAMLAEDNEKARVNGIYKAGIQAMKAAVTESEYRSAAETFKTIPGFRDADDLSLACQRKADEINEKRERLAEEARVAEEKTEKKRKRIIAIAASLLAACIVFAIVWKRVAIPNQKYAAATDLYTAGKYEEALAAFTALNGYKDSAAKIEACETAIKEKKYAAAVELYTAGRYEDAIAAFKELDGYKDSAAQIQACETVINDEKYAAAVELYSAGQDADAMAAFNALDGYKDSAAKMDEIKAKCFSDASVGSTIFFGFYEQDNDTSNGKEVVEWLVLATEGNRALIISKYALDWLEYAEFGKDPFATPFSLPRWLNGTFYNGAFIPSEQNMIVSSDGVFLLSITEVNTYFSSDEARMCAPTEYAIARGARTMGADGRATCWWWLGSVRESFYVAFVNYEGSVDLGGIIANKKGGVRPALWIDLGD